MPCPCRRRSRRRGARCLSPVKPLLRATGRQGGNTLKNPLTTADPYPGLGAARQADGCFSQKKSPQRSQAASVRARATVETSASSRGTSTAPLSEDSLWLMAANASPTARDPAVAFPLRVVTARPDADEADVVAIDPVHAGDDRQLVPSGAFARGDLPVRQRRLGRPRNDPAGIIGVAVPAPKARVGRGDEQRQRERSRDDGPAAHGFPLPPVLPIAYRSSGRTWRARIQQIRPERGRRRRG